MDIARNVIDRPACLPRLQATKDPFYETLAGVAHFLKPPSYFRWKVLSDLSKHRLNAKITSGMFAMKENNFVIIPFRSKKHSTTGLDCIRNRSQHIVVVSENGIAKRHQQLLRRAGCKAGISFCPIIKLKVDVRSIRPRQQLAHAVKREVFVTFDIDFDKSNRCFYSRRQRIKSHCQHGLTLISKGR